MMMNSNILNFLKVFILIDLILVIYGFIFQNTIWVLNTQIAFLGSLFITIASFLSYRKNINNRLSSLDEKYQNRSLEDRDKIDDIDDPFDLYSEYEQIPEDELSPEKIKEIINEEKSKLKKNSIKNAFTSAGSFVSIYRIFAYGILIFGFFALNNNGIFSTFPFLIGLGVVPLGVLLSKIVSRSSL